jgi:hypothetical protein
MRTSGIRPRPLFVLGALVLGVCLLFPGRAAFAQDEAAEEEPMTEIQGLPALPPGAEPISPGGAFLRSLIVPGWGHVATESMGRGAVYVTGQAASAWMLWKSSTRRREAIRFGRVERRVTAARLEAEGITDPDSLRVAVEEDSAVQAWEDLVESRGDQVEDWLVATFFLLLLGAADAYVTAHFLDYPEPLSFRVVPRGIGGGVELGVSIPMGGLPPGTADRRRR